MNQEQKGEMIGHMVQYERKLTAITEEVFSASFKADKLMDSLCKVDNDEYKRMIEDLQYTIGKIKGILK